jgi:hypothetical protein
MNDTRTARVGLIAIVAIRLAAFVIFQLSLMRNERETSELIHYLFLVLDVAWIAAQMAVARAPRARVFALLAAACASLVVAISLVYSFAPLDLLVDEQERLIRQAMDVISTWAP